MASSYSLNCPGVSRYSAGFGNSGFRNCPEKVRQWNHAEDLGGNPFRYSRVVER